MEFNVFSLGDESALRLVERALGSELFLGYSENNQEGLLNFPIIHNAGAKNSAKMSYTELRRPNIPLHSHEKTQHVYACMGGEMTVEVVSGSNVHSYDVGALSGCYIPAKIPHTVDAEHAVLLCVEVPPDTDDFKLYEVL